VLLHEGELLGWAERARLNHRMAGALEVVIVDIVLRLTQSVEGG
jgi:hypothetical protein